MPAGSGDRLNQTKVQVRSRCGISKTRAADTANVGGGPHAKSPWQGQLEGLQAGQGPGFTAGMTMMGAKGHAKLLGVFSKMPLTTLYRF